MEQSSVPRKWQGLAQGVMGDLGGGGRLAQGLVILGCSLTVAETAIASTRPESVPPESARPESVLSESVDLVDLTASVDRPATTVLTQTPESPFTPEPPSDEPSPEPAPEGEPEPPDSNPEAVTAPLELDPRIIEESPVLQQWLEEVPDIAEDIRHNPSFRTRLRVGYANFPSNGEISGFQVGVDDIFVWPGTGLTASADFSRSGNGQREAYGAEARYYLLPLGGYVNVAPTLGYRSVVAPGYDTSGLDVGLRLMIIPSRGGGTDLAVSQHWVAPGTDQEVGITRFNLGYAVTSHLRVGSDLELQNSRFGQESRWGLGLEWLL